MRTRWRRHTLLLVSLTLLFATAAVSGASAQTKDDVEKAEAAQERAYQELVDTRRELDAAVNAYEDVAEQVFEVSYRLERLDARIGQDQDAAAELRDTAQALVVEAYMNGSSASSVTVALEAETIQDVVTSQALYERANELSVATLDRLDSVSRELDRLSTDLEVDQEELSRLEVIAERALLRVEELLAKSKATHERKTDAAQAAVARYEAEQARKRAAEAARRAREAAARQAAARSSSGGSSGGSAAPRGGSGGGGSTVFGYLACPSGTPMAFRDTWGAPRSGGRSHKGTDIFASKGTRVVAVTDGRVRVGNGGLGGKSIWLYGSDGNAYYYAHLDSWQVTNGTRVGQGDLIATVGNTGNARGGANHTHFQLHPGGGSPRNPYPTLAAICNR
jgi:murein DD-endopeptidase MepM/ murein hydrolase activator NlpD